MPLAVEGPFEAHVRGSSVPPLQGSDLRAVAVRVGDHVRVPLGELAGRAIELNPARDGTLSVAGRRYRGDLRVQTRSRGGLRVVNTLPLEQYLRAVVGPEIGAGSPPASLEAQAVAARTFAIARRGRGALSDGTAAQVYGGIEREDPRTDLAIARTRGRVLLWQGKPFPTYFHSTCGGRTSDAAAVFGTKPFPPLAGAECGFCAGTRFALWQARLPRALLERLAAEAGVGSRVLGVEALSEDPAGTSLRLLLRGDLRSVEWTGDRFRAAANRLSGTELLRSARIEEVGPTEDGLLVRGRGWGHGVGLCQVGAIAMARAGYSAEEILLRYYPGAVLGSLESAP